MQINFPECESITTVLYIAIKADQRRHCRRGKRDRDIYNRRKKLFQKFSHVNSDTLISFNHKDATKDIIILLGTLVTFKQCCESNTEINNAIDQCIDITSMLTNIDDDTLKKLLKEGFRKA